VGAGGAHHAAVFLLAVRAPFAHHAVLFQLAVGARGAVRAAVFQLPVGAGVAHCAAAFHLPVRAVVAVHAVPFQLAVTATVALLAAVSSRAGRDCTARSRLSPSRAGTALLPSFACDQPRATRCARVFAKSGQVASVLGSGGSRGFWRIEKMKKKAWKPSEG
jgi:hypothetical protein